MSLVREHVHPGGDGDGDMSMSMQMWFTASSSATILFESWKVSGAGPMFGACCVVLLLAMLYEGLKYCREILLYKLVEKEALASNAVDRENNCSNTCGEKRTIRQSILSKQHWVQSGLHFVQVIVSYLLMLIVMSFNVWLCLAVVLGATLGYFLFGWVRKSTYEVTEHCH